MLYGPAISQSDCRQTISIGINKFLCFPTELNLCVKKSFRALFMFMSFLITNSKFRIHFTLGIQKHVPKVGADF